MRHLRLPAGFVLAATVFLFSAHPGAERGVYISHPGSEVVSGELTVEFRSDVPEDQRLQILASYGLSVDHEIGLDDFVVVSVPEAQKAPLGQALAQSDAVVTAEEIPLRYPAAAPDDPSYPQQWHLHMIRTSQARDVTRGAGARVAIVDTGVAFADGLKGGVQYAQAPDLANTVFDDAYDAITNDSFPFDDYGHGTHIAGTIAQNTDNGMATAGVAPEAVIMPIKVCKSTGPGPNDYGCPTDRIAAGVNWAIAEGADIINISIASGASITSAERQALVNAAEAGITVIAAGGNGGLDKIGDPFLEYPAAVKSVIAVAAVGIAGTRAKYSNYGQNELGERGVDVVAPGGDPQVEGPASQVLQQSYADCTQKDQDFTQFSVTPCAGTSMASAHVSGVAALIIARFGQLPPSQIRGLLRCSAEQYGAPPDFNYGYGLVQADDALADVDRDNIPDCLDTDLSTPSPSPVPPVNACGEPSLTPTPTVEPPTPTEMPSGPTPTASPVASITDSPTPRPTPTPVPSETQSGGGVDTPTPSPTYTPTGTPTDTPTGFPTDTPAATDTPTEAPTETPTATPTEQATPTPSPRGIQCGDVDCSGSVNGMDSLGVLRWMARITPDAGCIGKGYVNCDDVLDALDATTILRFSGGLSLNLPASCTGFG